MVSRYQSPRRLLNSWKLISRRAGIIDSANAGAAEVSSAN